MSDDAGRSAVGLRRAWRADRVQACGRTAWVVGGDRRREAKKGTMKGKRARGRERVCGGRLLRRCYGARWTVGG